MIEDEILELFGGSDLKNLVAVLPLGSPPHVEEDLLWALASSEEVMPRNEYQSVIAHVCSCRRCFSLLFKYRQDQRETNPPPSSALALEMRARWDDLRAAVFLIGLGAAGLKLRAHPFPIRMRDGGPSEADELSLRPGDSFPIELGDMTLSLRLVGIDANQNTFRLAIDVAEAPEGINLDDVQIQVRGESGDIVSSLPLTKRTVVMDDLTVAVYDLLVINSRDNQLIGSISFQPTSL